MRTFGMTNSNACTLETEASRIIERIVELLDETHVSDQVDHRLDRAEKLYWAAKSTSPPMTFHGTIATFVLHLYRYGLRMVRTLSPEQALSEAIHLLNAGSNAGGYDEACVAANDGDINAICQQIVETLRVRERRNYTSWVLSNHLTACDWPMRLAIASAILGQPAWRAARNGLLADRLAAALDWFIIKDIETRTAATPALRRT